MTTCAICLNTVRLTRNNQPIRCGHLFHSYCISEWKERGNSRCPMCRKLFDCENFRVQITIENNINETSNTLTANNDSIFDIFDIFFDVDTTEDLDSILSDFGMTITNFDPSIFDTE